MKTTTILSETEQNEHNEDFSFRRQTECNMTGEGVMLFFVLIFILLALVQKVITVKMYIDSNKYSHYIKHDTFYIWSDGIDLN